MVAYTQTINQIVLLYLSILLYYIVNKSWWPYQRNSTSQTISTLLEIISYSPFISNFCFGLLYNVQGVSHELNSCRITFIFLLQSVHSLYLSYLVIFLHAREALTPIWALFLQKFSAFISNFFLYWHTWLKYELFSPNHFFIWWFFIFILTKSHHIIEMLIFFVHLDFQVTTMQPFINLFNPKP